LFFVFSSGTWLPVVVGQIKKVYEQSMKDAEVSEAVVSKGPNEQNKSQFTKVVFSLISCFFLIIIVITVFVNVFFYCGFLLQLEDKAKNDRKKAIQSGIDYKKTVDEYTKVRQQWEDDMSLACLVCCLFFSYSFPSRPLIFFFFFFDFFFFRISLKQKKKGSGT